MVFEFHIVKFFCRGYSLDFGRKIRGAVGVVEYIIDELGKNDELYAEVVKKLANEYGLVFVPLQEKFDKYAEKYGNEALHSRLAAVDEISAAKIHPNNVKRVVRALEVYEKTGLKMSEQGEESKKGEKIYDYTEYAIAYDRDELYDRINRRVDIMFDMGLIPEVENLVRMGCTRDNTSMQGIGYKEVLDYLEGKVTLDEAKEMIKQGTRRYAKRQMTWFRRSNITWLSPGEMPQL